MKRLVIILAMMCLSVNYAIGQKMLHQGWYREEMTGPLGTATFLSRITFYNDYIEVAMEADIKNGTSSIFTLSGIQGDYRVYTKTTDYGPTLGKSVRNYLVDENFNVRYIQNGRESRIWKDGKSVSVGSSVNMGGYNSSTTSSGSSGGTTSQPRPQQTTKTCGVCYGTGTCNVCAGRGWVTVLGMGKNHPCTNCRNRDGKCPSCGGRGSWKE